MRLIFKSIVFGVVLTLLFTAKSFAISPEEFLATPCQDMVKQQRVANFSDELARKWQVAYSQDIYKIRKLKGRLSPKSKANNINVRLRDAMFKLRGNRYQQSLSDKENYRTRFLVCLDRKNQIRFNREVQSLKKEYKANVLKSKRSLKKSKKAFKKKMKALKNKAAKKVRSGQKKAAVKRWFALKSKPLIDNRGKVIVYHNNQIKTAYSTLSAGYQVAQEAFNKQSATNKNLALKTSSSEFNPLFRSIKVTELNLIKKTFQNVKDHIAVLYDRSRKDSFAYNPPVNGVPNVNWRQVSTKPSRFGSRSQSLVGREAVKINKPKIYGGGQVLAVGDSIQAGMKSALRSALPNSLKLTHSAVGGYNSIQIYDLFNRAYNSKKHSVIIFDAGTNDNPNYPSILKEQLKKVAKKIGPRRCLIVPTVNTLVVGGVGASGKNNVIRSFAKSRKLTFVPDWQSKSSQGGLMYDSLHPNSRGNAVRAKMISDAVKRCFS